VASLEAAKQKLERLLADAQAENVDLKARAKAATLAAAEAVAAAEEPRVKVRALPPIAMVAAPAYCRLAVRF
jgi:hypothetical protein